MLESLLGDARRQWQESRLLRLGCWAIVLMLLLYLLLWLDDQLALKQLEWRRHAQARAELQALQQQKYWPALVDKLQAQRQALLADTWEANTPGLAKAAVREFISQSIRESALQLRRTEFAEPQPLTEGVWEMRGQMTALTDGSSVPWAWLATLEGHRPAFIIDYLDIRVGLRSGVAVTLEFRIALRGLEEPQP